jgi:hypothetical protein
MDYFCGNFDDLQYDVNFRGEKNPGNYASIIFRQVLWPK